MRNKQRGFGHIELFLVLIVLAAVGFAGWWVWQKNQKDEPKTSTQTPTSTAKKPAETKTVKDFVREAKVLDSAGYNNHEVITLPDGKYRMFFHDRNQIKSALSNNGKQFTLEGGVRVLGEMPATVKLPDGKWRMYFKDSSGIKSAVSSDGFSFTVENGVRLPKGSNGAPDDGGLIHPSVVALPDGSYRMFYDGVDTTSMQQGPDHWTIMSARSTDGLTWQKDSGVRIDVHNEDKEIEIGETLFDSAFSSHIEFKDGTYTMYFTAETDPGEMSGIWVATSKDGLTFTISDKPVLARDSKWGTGESQQASSGGPKGVPQDPFFLHLSSGDRLFYWVVEEGTYSAFRPN